MGRLLPAKGKPDVNQTKTPPGVEQNPATDGENCRLQVNQTKTPPGVEQISGTGRSSDSIT